MDITYVKEFKYFSFYISEVKKKKKSQRMTTLGNEKRTSIQLAMVSYILSYQKVSFSFPFVVYYVTIGRKDSNNCSALNSNINRKKKNVNWISGIEFSPFNCGRYLCFESGGKTIHLLDVETSKLLHAFNGHEDAIWCVDISPLQSSKENSSKSNSIGVIGGNGYTICSGSYDKTIRIWDIETTKQLIIFEGHRHFISSVKYGSNKLEFANTVLSESDDTSVRLWDIRSGKQIQEFSGHTGYVNAVEYSPFIDIRSNKNELYTTKGNKEDGGIYSFKFLQLKKNKRSNSRGCGIYLIRIWG
ncbi:WD-40 repeat-containing protein [Reticulomyxa filosa]|uniref:WD-40 repeat-containing protein n=1 Tax=Reticulomyxa filosa TaxID=46433 RepID=X6P036_RETFI|nr:WD-40 repeat-containing protein [Reticulomyxa filosa]|eukprot:ETO31920.1 WD-40 repeat-containing protein [Reticulomyxa filosa]